MQGDIRGDMFFIKHDNDSFTVIDCNLADGREEEILNRIYEESKDKSYMQKTVDIPVLGGWISTVFCT